MQAPEITVHRGSGDVGGLRTAPFRVVLPVAAARCLQRAHTIRTLPEGDGSGKHDFCSW